jgi:thiol-disulfide isomerase/thioredoxin
MEARVKYFLVIVAVFVALFTVEAQNQTSTQETQSMEPDKSDDHNFLPLGELTSNQIIYGSRIFDMRYVDYVPNSDAVQSIHNLQKPVEIKVFWGDWCKESKKYVPGFIKSMEFAENKNISITYVNLDREKKEPAEAIAGWDIQNIPTFIVIYNGKEIGRIVETPKVTVEQDLAQILTQLTNQ